MIFFLFLHSPCLAGFLHKMDLVDFFFYYLEFTISGVTCMRYSSSIFVNISCNLVWACSLAASETDTGGVLGIYQECLGRQQWKTAGLLSSQNAEKSREYSLPMCGLAP